MKKIFSLILLTIAALAVSAGNAAHLANDDYRQALYGALGNAAPALKTAPFGKKTIAILPMRSGHDLLAGRLKNMLTAAGFVCVEGKEDPMWDKILGEIEWDERKSDILDQKTIVKFGRLKAAQIVLQCDIRILDKNADRIYAELELRAIDIATKQVVWGGTFANRYYIGKNIQGIVSIDDDLRQTLQKSFAEAKKNLTAPHVSGKLNRIKTITVVPLNGDIDSYITNLATVMITQTHLHPQDPHIPSLMQIRSAARDGLLKSDAIFYGSVRALHKTVPVETQVGEKIVVKYNVIAEIQIFIEDAKTGNILWGETINITQPVTKEKELSPAELEKYREKVEEEKNRKLAAERTRNIWKIIGIIAGVLAAAGLIIFAVRSFFTIKNVR